MIERRLEPPADFAPPRRVSPEEARRITESTNQRFEYWHGWLYPRGYPPGSHWAMSGGTRAYSRVISRIIRILDEHLETGPCTVYEGNVELHVADDEYYFPDAFVTCTPMDDPAPSLGPDFRASAPCFSKAWRGVVHAWAQVRPHRWGPSSALRSARAERSHEAGMATSISPAGGHAWVCRRPRALAVS